MGFLNRNAMISSAHAGARHLVDRGVEFSVRVRSGNIVTGDTSDFISRIFLPSSSRLRKLAFFMGWSWKNIPFHISDAFMIGRASDVLDLWSVPLDSRTKYDFPDISYKNNIDHFSILKDCTNECYLWRHLAERWGYPVIPPFLTGCLSRI